MTFVTAKVTKTICAERLPLRFLARLARGLFISSELPRSKLPPSAGDFCYGKSHQNHLRRTAAATRFPARLARQAPRRTQAIHGPRTIGACSPVGLRFSAAFKARQVKTRVFLPINASRSRQTAGLWHAGFDSVSCKDQKLPPSAGDFCYGKSHQNHVRRTAAATRFPARLARQAPRRTRAIHGPRTIGACSPGGLRCSAAFKARVSQNPCVIPVSALQQLIQNIAFWAPRSLLCCKAQEHRVCGTPAFAFPAPSKHAERRSMARGKGPHVRAHGCASSDRPAPCQPRRASARSADVRQARMVLLTFAVTKVGRRRRKPLLLASHEKRNKRRPPQGRSPCCLRSRLNSRLARPQTGKRRHGIEPIIAHLSSLASPCPHWLTVASCSNFPAKR